MIMVTEKNQKMEKETLNKMNDEELRQMKYDLETFMLQVKRQNQFLKDMDDRIRKMEEEFMTFKKLLNECEEEKQNVINELIEEYPDPE